MMVSPIIDTHAHLDMEPFDKDRNETIARARAAGVTRIITIGLDLESSRKAIELAETHPDIFATVGFHPHEAGRMKDSDTALLADMARHPKVVAIGEIGLDFYRNRSSKDTQLQALGWQLELADSLSQPIVIHCREAQEDMIPVLDNWTRNRQTHSGRPPGVIHCFNSKPDIAQKYLDMGFYIALGAYIGYPTSRALGESVRRIPSDRLLVETDCPFLPPQSHRGKRNEPAYLPTTVEAIAKIRNVSPQTIAEETTRNAFQLFRFFDLRNLACFP